MRSNIHWIEVPLAGRLAIVPRPRSGDWLNDEIAGWKAEGVDLMVGLLESEEVAELDLHSEAGLCDKHAIEFVPFRFRIAECRRRGPRPWLSLAWCCRGSLRARLQRFTAEPASDAHRSSQHARWSAWARTRIAHSI